jgi:formylglycine-generating enzyme required for sulfatase activity
MFVGAMCVGLIGCPPPPSPGEGPGEVAGEGQAEGVAKIEEYREMLLSQPVPQEVRTFGGIEMVWCPAGSFMMGSESGDSDESPVHEVTLTQGFWMGKYEVTKAQWEAVMGTTPWAGLDWILDDPDSSAVCVSWNNVQDFITALNAQTDESFRLPTEAQWEYACRAGTTTAYSFGDDSGDLSDYAWWLGSVMDGNEKYAHVIGHKLPNPWGLHDMHGNVWEWCQDSYGSDYYSSSSSTDPTGPWLGRRCGLLPFGGPLRLQPVARVRRPPRVPPLQVITA